MYLHVPVYDPSVHIHCFCTPLPANVYVKTEHDKTTSCVFVCIPVHHHHYRDVKNGIVTTPPRGPTATGNASYFHAAITNGPNQGPYRRRRTNTPSLSLTGSTECLPSPAEGVHTLRVLCTYILRIFDNCWSTPNVVRKC